MFFTAILHYFSNKAHYLNNHAKITGGDFTEGTNYVYSLFAVTNVKVQRFNYKHFLTW